VTAVHRIMTKQPNETMRRLREHGFNPSIAEFDQQTGRCAIDFLTTARLPDADLDFLRPDILPPRNA
jgi:hypothetical protein